MNRKKRKEINECSKYVNKNKNLILLIYKKGGKHNATTIGQYVINYFKVFTRIIENRFRKEIQKKLKDEQTAYSKKHNGMAVSKR